MMAKRLPQLQRTSIVALSGWIPFFMSQARLRGRWVRRAACILAKTPPADKGEAATRRHRASKAGHAERRAGMLAATMACGQPLHPDAAGVNEAPSPAAKRRGQASDGLRLVLRRVAKRTPECAWGEPHAARPGHPGRRGRQDAGTPGRPEASEAQRRRRALTGAETAAERSLAVARRVGRWARHVVGPIEIPRANDPRTIAALARSGAS